MGKAKSSVSEKTLKHYEKIVATIPDLPRKGAKNPYTSVNGHMFSFLTQEGTLALRLEKEQRDAFLKKHNTKLCEQYGTVMKEYVEVPDSVFNKTAQIKNYFAASYEYVSSLKPKPTTRKKSAKKKAAKKKAVKQKSEKKSAVKKKRPRKNI